MEIKFILNKEQRNSVFLCLIPLMITSNTAVNSIITTLLLLTTLFLTTICFTVLNKKLKGNSYKAPIYFAISITVPITLGVILSLIFITSANYIFYIATIVTISQLILSIIVKINSKSYKSNIMAILPIMVVMSATLLVFGFLREILGSGLLFGFSLLKGNLRPIELFNKTAGGLLLLGVIIFLYSLLVKNDTEEEE